MARQDTLNAKNLATLKALIAAGGEAAADAQIEGVDLRSLPKLVRMGYLATTETTLTVTDAGYREAGHDTGEDNPPADAPKADAPKADAPKADAPKADAPKADAPK